MHTEEFDRSLATVAPLLGRILVSIIFILSGFSKFGNWDSTLAMMAGHGLPLAPLLLAIAAVMEVVGGISVLVGFKARWGAYLLFLYLVPVTLIMHNYWAYTGQEFMMQQINFLKNLAIMGGLLYIGTFGAGRYSFDARDRFALPPYMKEQQTSPGRS